jgi:flagellar protein FliS
MAFNQANQAYAEYNRNKVLTASPAELTLILYEGAIKFCNIAIIGLEQNDMEKTHNNIVKVENIIEEFQQLLIINIRLQKILIKYIDIYMTF